MGLAPVNTQPIPPAAKAYLESTPGTLVAMSELLNQQPPPPNAAAKKAKKSNFKAIKIRRDQIEAMGDRRWGINGSYVIGRTHLRNPEAERRLLRATIIPLPELDPFWKVLSLRKISMKTNAKSNAELSEKKVEKLKIQATLTPGSVRLELLKLMRKYPKSEELFLINGVATFYMLKNTLGHLQEVVEGLRLATRDAAAALVTDNISLANMKAFFEIYFGFLEKLVLLQKRTLIPFKGDMQYGNLVKNLDYGVQINELLLDKRKEANNMISFLATNFNRSSIANPTFGLLTIKKAVDYVNAGMGQKKMDHGTADEMVEFAYGIMKVLVKIPALESIVQDMLKFMASTRTDFRLQHVSILSNKLFFEFKILMILRELDRMRTLARRLFRINLNMIKVVKNRSIQKPVEFEPFLNLALITEFSLNLFPKEEQEEMLSTSFKLLERVTLLDQTDKRTYMTEAAKLMGRLDHLLENDKTLQVDHSIDPFADKQAPQEEAS